MNTAHEHAHTQRHTVSQWWQSTSDGYSGGFQVIHEGGQFYLQYRQSNVTNNKILFYLYEGGYKYRLMSQRLEMFPRGLVCMQYRHRHSHGWSWSPQLTWAMQDYPSSPSPSPATRYTLVFLPPWAVTPSSPCARGPAPTPRSRAWWGHRPGDRPRVRGCLPPHSTTHTSEGERQHTLL